MQEMMDWCSSLIMQDTELHFFFFFFNVAKAVSCCVLSIRIKSHRCHKSEAMCTLTMPTTLDLLTSDCLSLWIKTNKQTFCANESASLNNSRRTFELSLSCGGACARLIGGESHGKEAAA